jgi:hypothetical protein
MEGLVDEVGEGKITMEEFEKREKELEREKMRELGEEEEEKKDEEEVVKRVQEKVVVEVPAARGKRDEEDRNERHRRVRKQMWRS